MNKFRRNSTFQLFSFLATLMFVLTSAPATLFAQETSMTRINHEPISYFVAGKRIRLAADVTDLGGVKLVRCYFKGQEQADFVFVNMIPAGDTYTAILPATARNATTIQYMFLAVNNRNQVVKTMLFSVNKDDSQPAPPWQDVAMDGQVTVSTELAKAPTVLEGFSDSIAMNVVESAARFGFVVGGIYTATQIAAAGGATGASATATSAVSASTATASGGGMSTGAIIGVTAGGLAVVGGGVALAGAISKSSTESSTTTTTCSCNAASYSLSGATCSCTNANTVTCTGTTAASYCAAGTWGDSVTIPSDCSTGVFYYFHTKDSYRTPSCAANNSSCISSSATTFSNHCLVNH